MTFKLLKRRYRSAETNEKLRQLDYFNHPYDPDNGIRLLDDYDLSKSLSLTSLSTQFVPTEDLNKRGKKSAAEREEKGKYEVKNKLSGYDLEFEPFDMSQTKY